MFFDELLSDFYEKIGPGFRQSRIGGQICYTQVTYSFEHKEIWRPVGYDGTQTSVTEFHVSTAAGDAYNRRQPLATPKLETNEEFPVVRAKRRPVIVIKTAPDPPPVKALPGGSRLNWPLAIVAPCYSVVGPMRRAKYPTEFIERVRRLEFPEVFFLPEEAGALDQDSLLPLYRLTNAYQSHLEPSEWKLKEPVLRVLQGQVRFYLTGEYAGDYRSAREMLLHPQ